MHLVDWSPAVHVQQWIFQRRLVGVANSRLGCACASLPLPLVSSCLFFRQCHLSTFMSLPQPHRAPHPVKFPFSLSSSPIPNVDWPRHAKKKALPLNPGSERRSGKRRDKISCRAKATISPIAVCRRSTASTVDSSTDRRALGPALDLPPVP